MTSTAQIASNRQNAKLSTGPRTAAGKQATSRNATKFGLFSAQNCIHPQDREEYEDMSAGLLQELTPLGNIEDMFATEVIRCSWRLRRCAVAEAQLGEQTEESGLDPSIVPGLDRQQAATDRARSSAQNGLRRAFISLSNHQNQRVIKDQTAVRIDVSQAGVANVAAISHADQLARANGFAPVAKQSQPARSATEPIQTKPVTNQTQTAGPVPAPEAAITNQTQSVKSAIEATLRRPVANQTQSFPCPCGSGLKFHECCSDNAPQNQKMAA